MSGKKTFTAAAALALGLSFSPSFALAGDEASDAPRPDPSRVARALERARALESDVEAVVSRASPAFVVIGGGSGIVVSPEGDILTNHHVAGGRGVGQVWRLTLPGRGIQEATVIGHDPRGDISLLRLSGKGPWPHVEIADSDAVEVGDFSIALGNPFGHAKDSTPTVSVGVVSAVHRYQGGYSDAIQTDAAVNPGNSGGPLLDGRGRLIGINGRIAVRHGTKVNTGVGYAIPSNQIKRFLAPFRKDGTVHHGLVAGLVIGNTRAGGEGAYVERVVSGSDAERAGLAAGDVIVEADGRAVEHAARFHGIVGTIPAGERIALRVKRRGETRTFDVPLVSRDGEGEPAVTAGGPYLGVRMGQVPAGEEKSGVPVEEVETGSPAAAAGIKPGDRITHVGGKHVFSVNEVITLIAERKPGQKVVLALRRAGKPVELQVTIGKRPAEKKPEKKDDDDE